MGYEKEFFAIRIGALKGLELRNFIENVTGIKHDKLELLLNELNRYYDREVRKFSDEELSVVEKEFKNIHQSKALINQLIKKKSGNSSTSVLPNPYSVADSFLNKSMHSKYPIEVIGLAMSYARDYRHESNYSEIIRKFLDDEKCPPKLSMSNYNAIQNWIKAYDKAAGIVRKRNPRF